MVIFCKPITVGIGCGQVCVDKSECLKNLLILTSSDHKITGFCINQVAGSLT